MPQLTLASVDDLRFGRLPITDVSPVAQGHVHTSVGTLGHHSARAFNNRGNGAPATGPRAAPRHPELRLERAGAEARGFVVYVGMPESAAAATGASLTRLAGELRHYVQSVVPSAETTATVVFVPSGAPGKDLEVVRQVLGDPTIPPGARPEWVQTPVAVATDRPGAVIDLSRREIHLDGLSVSLGNKEFAILHYLMTHHNRTVFRGELIESVWEHAEQVPSERAVDVSIRRLRSKLGRFASAVATVHGSGYAFYKHPDINVRATPDPTVIPSVPVIA